nr:tyrosine-type recombinase/integrase [Virgibacillus halotolerans]
MKGVALPKVAKQIRDGFTSDEVVSMIDAFNYKDYINARNKAIVAMLADTGLRAIEITNLPSDAVKNINMLVIGKGRKERIVYISPALRQILIKYERIKRKYFKDKLVKSDTYFLNYKGEEMSHVGLWKVAKLAGELAGVQDVHPHKFRHYYAVQCVKSKMDIYSLSRLLGHSDVSTTQIYLESLNHDELLDKAIASSPLMNIAKTRRNQIKK